MPEGAFPTGGGRKILATGTHTVSGYVSLPNGADDQGRTPPYTGFSTGPCSIATTVLGCQIDNCAVSFWSYGPESHVSSNVVGANIQVGSNGFAQLNFDDRFEPNPDGSGSIASFSFGRGMDFLDVVEGSFSFSIAARLVVDTYGEELPDDAIPDDNYPSYGGVRIVGEFPSNYGLLHWEPIPGAQATGTVTLHGRTATATGTGTFTGDASWSCSVTHSAGAAYEPGYGGRTPGRIEASIGMTGFPIAGDSASKVYTYQGTPNMASEVGAGWARVWVDNAIPSGGGVPSGDVGGLTAGGIFAIPREATVLLDAVAMDHPHPHACAWRAILGYQGTTDEPDEEGYYGIIDPPLPIVTELTGQSVSAQVRQRSESIASFVTAKTYDAFTRSGGHLARGYLRNGNYVVYDSYRNEVGPVKAWIVPPPGEDPDDWRVGFLGLAEDALTIDHAPSLSIPVPSGSPQEGGTLYDFGGAVAEGYRYADVVADEGEIFTTATKAWSIQDGASTIDLCFPDAIGTGSLPDHDSQDTRWPLDSSATRKSRVNTPYWGVSVLDAVTLTGGSLSSLTLKRIGPAKLRFLAPFVQSGWEYEVPDDELQTAGGDSYTVEHWCSRLLIGDVDGRQAMEIPHVRKTVNNAPGRKYSTDYFHLPVSTVAQLVAEIPGWSASPIGEMGSEPSWYMALGFIRQGGQWIKTFDRGPGTAKTQPRYDSMSWSGDIKTDVFQVGGGSGLILVGRKVFRGAAYGSTKNDGTVHASDITGPGALDQATSGKRYGLLGPTLSDPNDWGLVWVDPAHKASVGGLPRRIQRVAFGIAAKSGKGLAYDVAPNARHYRAHVDGTIVVRATGNLAPFDGAERVSATETTWIRIRAERAGRELPLWAMYGDGSTVYAAKTLDEGVTFIQPMTIGNGKHGDFDHGQNGTRWFYWVEGGTVKFALYDAFMTQRASGVTNVSDVAEDGQIAVRESVGPDGKWRMGLFYETAGGGRSFVAAEDGKTFS